MLLFQEYPFSSVLYSQVSVSKLTINIRLLHFSWNMGFYPDTIAQAKRNRNGLDNIAKSLLTVCIISTGDDKVHLNLSSALVFEQRAVIINTFYVRLSIISFSFASYAVYHLRENHTGWPL